MSDPVDPLNLVCPRTVVLNLWYPLSEVPSTGAVASMSGLARFFLEYYGLHRFLLGKQTHYIGVVSECQQA